MSDKEMKVQHKQEVQQAGEPTKPERYFVPAVDIYESEEAVHLRAEMPGVDKDGVEINLENDTLTIRGVKAANGGENERVLLREFETGHYLRRFTIAETIDQEKIEAGMADGLLKLTLPKVEPARPRRIEVKCA
ncbi:Hsp20/alpha crystallin family protein [Desulfurivibrio alkaliphilus]|uniref:Heat shock protein Hsp20 n=1 Tax=Desulfurivibrio alkaliphilus (strain DSM 19089 / UNIQEM U267 / AHT2) TaxID=589865 RepID=D6YZY1_DESAT|nr:Hsp20/alpha crystallin family protein [Desulfurivibrio alkaliphilus]ADH85138.1 heat shock protein Hsp20 [Desulfurivibrio alkaliphilus AHT 2]